MIGRLQNWISRKIALGGFTRGRDVLYFAATRTVWTTLAAVALNSFIYEIVSRTRILNVPVPENPAADALVTALVAGPISFLAFYVVGRAIFDLAVSRNAFERLSRIDPLTGLLNRRAFLETVAGMREDYLLVLFDIDRFKSINDRYGHPAGDTVLADVSALLEACFAGKGITARLGGEEFGLLLHGSDRVLAMAEVERFRIALADRRFVFDGVDCAVTISAGISEAGGGIAYSMLLTSADRALYIAKASGRNRTVDAEELAVLAGSGDMFGQRRVI